MSFFGATLETIAQIKKHSNADKLEIGKLDGCEYQFVIPKGRYNVGDKVIYLPIDSVLPEELVKKIGLEGRLAGIKKNRIKTAILRGEISQGVVCDISIIDGCSDITPSGITSFLGIEKYSPLEKTIAEGVLTALPEFLSKYDIENAENHSDVVNKMMDMNVFVTEKIEGSNCSVSYDITNDKFSVNQRENSIVEIESGKHTFWEVARKNNIFEKLKNIAIELGAKSNISIYFEMIGPGYQGNIYKLKENNAISYDLKIDFKWVNSGTFFDIVKKYDIYCVPLLSSGCTLRQYLNGKTLQEKSNGTSMLYKTLREGIVIKPEIEQYSNELCGRLFIKQRDPIYLANDLVSMDEAKKFAETVAVEYVKETIEKLQSLLDSK